VDHTVARRHEPGRQGIHRFAAGPDRGADPEREGRRRPRDARSPHHQPFPDRRFCPRSATGFHHASTGADPPQSSLATAPPPPTRGPVGRTFHRDVASHGSGRVQTRPAFGTLVIPHILNRATAVGGGVFIEAFYKQATPRGVTAQTP